MRQKEIFEDMKELVEVLRACPMFHVPGGPILERDSAYKYLEKAWIMARAIDIKMQSGGKS